MFVRLFTVLFSILLVSNTASAARLYVANNGQDYSLCGSKKIPCRSISQAIANASAGDLIVVGPGFYGDLDQDGTLGGIGEEFGPDSCSNFNCMIHIDKAVKIISEQGAEHTLISAYSLNDNYYSTAVFISAHGVVFGRKNKGFTVAYANSVAVRVDANDVTVGHSILTKSGDGLVFDGYNAKILSNQIIANDDDGLVLGCEEEMTVVGATVAKNNISYNGDIGAIVCNKTQDLTFRNNVLNLNVDDSIIGSELSSAKFINNTTTGGLESGVLVSNSTDITIRKHSSIGNLSYGIYSEFDSPVLLSKSQIIGNYLIGVGSEESDSFVMKQTDVYGNGRAEGEDYNCGFGGYDGVWEIDKDYWGDPSGPGNDPADTVCGDATEDDIMSYLLQKIFGKKKKRRG